MYHTINPKLEVYVMKQGTTSTNSFKKTLERDVFVFTLLRTM